MPRPDSVALAHHQLQRGVPVQRQPVVAGLRSRRRRNASLQGSAEPPRIRQQRRFRDDANKHPIMAMDSLANISRWARAGPHPPLDTMAPTMQELSLVPLPTHAGGKSPGRGRAAEGEADLAGTQ